MRIIKAQEMRTVLPSLMRDADNQEPAAQKAACGLLHSLQNILGGQTARVV